MNSRAMSKNSLFWTISERSKSKDLCKTSNQYRSTRRFLWSPFLCFPSRHSKDFLWVLCGIKCCALLSYPEKKSEQWIYCMSVPIKVFFQSTGRTEHSFSLFFQPFPENTVQVSKKNCVWASDCQHWSASVISLLLLQSDLSFWFCQINYFWMISWL